MDASSKMNHVSSIASYATSGGTVLFGTLTSNDLAAIGGLILAFATFCVNFWYKRAHYRLALELAEKGHGLDRRLADP